MSTLVARLLPLLLLAASAPPLAPGDPGERGRALYELGRYAEAEPHLRVAVEAAERTRGPGDPATADALEALAELYWAQDRHAEAEPLLERAVAIRERTLGRDHPALATALNRWASLHLDEGGHVHAEPLLERALAILGAAPEPREATLGDVLDNLALLRHRQGRDEEAEALYRRSVEIEERALRPGHPEELAAALANLGELHVHRGRYVEAEPPLARSVALLEAALGPDHPRLTRSLGVLGVLRAEQGRHAEAERLFRRSLRLRELASGPGGVAVASDLILLGNLHLRQGRTREALAAIRRAAAIQVAATPSAASHATLEARTRAFQSHVGIGWALAAADPALRAELTDETFRAGQLAHTSDTAASVARVAARFAAGDGELARLVRRQQDLAARRRALEETAVELAGRDPAGEAGLRRELADTASRLEALDRELARRFPDYDTLVDPEPAGVEEVRALLGPDEALLAYLVLAEDREWLREGAVFLWLVRRDRAEVRRLPLSPSELDREVRGLRAQLDPERWSGDTPPPFDAARAHELHARLLPADPALLAGVDHLLVVPHGPLESLPLAVLVRTPPAAGAVPHEVDWLARSFATTTLPSVASLRAQRRMFGSSRAAAPFRGVGDPALAGASGARRGLGVAPLTGTRGLADLRLVRALPPLPETAEELRTLAAAVGAGEDSLLLGRRATERAVKAGALAGARVVAFATHAGVAGELPGLAEPALVLTPPDVASEEDDGLLTASEAALLELDADLVLLSACNTAAPDGTPGAPGLSGLARAFIYAGGRSLLVSHWSVISEAAQRLTTGMLAELRRDPDLGRSEALRRSMLALAADGARPAFAHPAAWAPFVVVGQGGAPATRRSGARPRAGVAEGCCGG